MKRNYLSRMPMDRLDQFGANADIDWLWHGYIARGAITLLTSLWKAGKTTLVAGLLQRLGAGGDFLGQACRAGRVIMVSEESVDLWAERLRTISLGSHAQLVSRPFRTRPSVDQWNDLIDEAVELRRNGELDLLVVDPLASFLPGRSDSDAGTLLDMLQPLQRLAAAGVAVLVLHHPRKNRADEGSSARGSGALLGFVDIILELHRFGNLKSDQFRRRLISRSRHQQTPAQLFYEWNSQDGGFAIVDDPHRSSFREHWDELRTILVRRKTAGSTRDIWLDWPEDAGRPSLSALLRWLHCAYDEKLVRRAGSGVKTDPYRYRLPNEDDEYWDRGELPPLKPLPI